MNNKTPFLKKEFHLRHPLRSGDAELPDLPPLQSPNAEAVILPHSPRIDTKKNKFNSIHLFYT